MPRATRANHPHVPCLALALKHGVDRPQLEATACPRPRIATTPSRTKQVQVRLGIVGN